MRKLALSALSLLLFREAAPAANWPMYQADAQRSGWQKDETILSTRTVKDLRLLWKRKLENRSFGLNSLSAPTIVERVITHHGFQELVFIQGSSGRVFAVDADLGKLLWQRELEPSASSDGKDSCGDGLTAAPVFNPVPREIAAEDDDNDLSSLNPVYALSRAGTLFALRPINGADMQPPLPFVPGAGRASNPALFEGFVYTTVRADCGDARSGVWAIDVMAKNVSGSDAQKKIRSFENGGMGGGALGIASDATLFSKLRTRVGEGLLALFPVNLMPKAIYTTARSRGAENSIASPAIFDWKGRHLIAGMDSAGAPFLVDERAMKRMGSGGAARVDERAGKTDNAAAQRGGAATWEDASGQRWICFSSQDSRTDSRGVHAFQVTERHGEPVLEPVWRRADIQTPSAPAVANGVVYVLSTGEFTGAARSAKERIARSRPAVLYALDAATGAQLFSSGKTVTAFDHSSGLAVANGHVCFGTWDATLYCFGLPIDF